jgi:hypothetical protein
VPRQPRKRSTSYLRRILIAKSRRRARCLGCFLERKLDLWFIYGQDVNDNKAVENLEKYSEEFCYFSNSIWKNNPRLMEGDFQI